MRYCETTIYRKARKVGYKVEKGLVKHIDNGAIYTDSNGRKHVGYNVIDVTTGESIWGCHDHNYDHLFSLEDVEEFLIDAYKDLSLAY